MLQYGVLDSLNSFFQQAKDLWQASGSFCLNVIVNQARPICLLFHRDFVMTPELMKDINDRGLDFETPTIGRYAIQYDVLDSLNSFFQQSNNECKARAFMRMRGLGQSEHGKTAFLVS
jgi:hypothetical protein